MNNGKSTSSFMNKDVYYKPQKQAKSYEIDMGQNVKNKKKV